MLTMLVLENIYLPILLTSSVCLVRFNIAAFFFGGSCLICSQTCARFAVCGISPSPREIQRTPLKLTDYMQLGTRIAVQNARFWLNCNKSKPGILSLNLNKVWIFIWGAGTC